MSFTSHNEIYDLNTHDYVQIFIPLDDSSSIALEDGVHPVPKKGICFIPPHVLHKRLTSQHHITINIPTFLLCEPEANFIKKPIITDASSTSDLLLDIIVKEITAHPDSRSTYILYYHFYNKMKAYYLEQTISQPSLLYVHRHFEDNLTISFLASLEGYSQSYFSSWFFNMTGYQPSLYLQLVRIGKAKEMLITSDYDIKEISQLVGFGSHSAFTRAFTKRTGCTPSEYRVRYNKQAENFETTCPIIVSNINTNKK